MFYGGSNGEIFVRTTGAMVDRDRTLTDRISCLVVEFHASSYRLLEAGRKRDGTDYGRYYA